MGMYANAIIELGKYLCTKCSKEHWAFIQTQEEASSLTCECCESQTAEALINSPNPTNGENLEKQEDNAQ